jgi:hypothetical protein
MVTSEKEIKELADEYMSGEFSGPRGSFVIGANQGAALEDRYLDAAIDAIIEAWDDDCVICERLIDNKDETKICASECSNLTRDCVIRYLKLKVKEKNEEKKNQKHYSGGTDVRREDVQDADRTRRRNSRDI